MVGSGIVVFLCIYQPYLAKLERIYVQTHGRTRDWYNGGGVTRHLPDEGWEDVDTDSDADGGGHSGSVAATSVICGGEHARGIISMNPTSENEQVRPYILHMFSIPQIHPATACNQGHGGRVGT
jgi:hypothetical protein